MKYIYLLFWLFSTLAVAQSGKDTLVVRNFSFSPMSSKTDVVNGLVLGAFHIAEKERGYKQINGLNLEVNPLAFIFIVSHFSETDDTTECYLKHNGLHISTSGYLRSVMLNGVGVSAFNVGYAANGVTVNVLENYCGILNGLHITAFLNQCRNGNGLLLAAVNYTENYNGLQVGLFNRARRLRGVQLGLWNKNEKRSLPFINWNFK